MKPALAILVLCSLRIAAQTVTGSLQGRITDPSGGVVTGAEVTAKNSDTGLTRVAKTNSSGYFQIAFLPVGAYGVTARASGFGPVARSAQVELSSARDVDFELKPASVDTAVTVTAESPLIDTSRGDLKSTIDEKTIEDRPLSSRNILSLVEQLPGFQSTGGYSGVNNPTLSSGSYVSFNGAGSRSVSFQIDGVNNDDSSEGTNRQNVNISSIKQFQVLTNSYSAEFGRAGGAVVLVETKSGTNRFHGDLYEFLQNDKLNANSYFNNSFGSKPDGTPVAPRPPYRRNQYGYTVGGPVIKNKLFLFHSFEQTKLAQYNTFTRFIFLPTEKLQVGTCRLCLNPDEHPNLQQDLAFLEGIMDRFPKKPPNNLNTCDHCYTQTEPARYPDADYSGRIDFNPTQRDTFAVRYQYSRQRRAPLDLIVGEQALQNNRQQNVGLTATHMFSPSTFGEFRFGLGLRTTMVDIEAGDNTPIVRISNPVGFGTTLGSAGAFPIHRYQTDYQYVYNLSHVRGIHTFRAGIDFRRQHLDDLADNFSRGFWTFGATGVLGAPTRYEGYENFLRGYVTSFEKGYGNFTTFNRLGEFNQYVMDDIRVKPQFTLNLGFRYEVVLSPEERDHKIDYKYSTFYKGYEPRFGFAWSPRGWTWLTGGPGRFSVRGGFGMFHNRIFQSVFSQGNTNVRSLPPYGADRSYDPTFHVGDPSDGYVFTPGTYNPGRITGSRIDPDLKPPTTQQYHFTIDRQFSSNMMVSIGYTRTRGIGLLQNQIVNRARFPFLSPVDGVLYDKIDPDLGDTSPPPGYISLAQPRTNQRRPNVNFSNIYVIGNQSWSYYNALRVEIKRRYSHGLQWQVAYSFSKSIDTGSDVTQGNSLTELSSARSLRALSDFDQRHRFNGNFSYLLPFWRDGHGLRGRVLGGWTLAGNTTFASGNPFTVTAGYDYNGDGVSNDRPILLDNSIFGRSIDHPNTSQSRLPLTAFYPNVRTSTAQRPFDPGGSDKDSIGRNTFFGQGLMNVDLAIHKAFVPHEGHRLTFRAEAFGLTNSPHFSFPTTSTASVNFGRITGTYNPFNFVGASRNDAASRIVQLALRYTF